MSSDDKLRKQVEAAINRTRDIEAKAREMSAVQLANPPPEACSAYFETLDIDEVPDFLRERICGKADPRMAPLFNSTTLESFVLVLAVLVGSVFACGAFYGGSGIISMKTAEGDVRGLSISDIHVKPGSEITVVSNRSQHDLVRILCSCCWFYVPHEVPLPLLHRMRVPLSHL